MNESKVPPRPFAVGEEPQPGLHGRVASIVVPGSKGPRDDAERVTMRKIATARIKRVSQFIKVTMRHLRPAEIAVWLAIFQAEHNGVAQIGFDRLVEVAGKSERHVGEAVKSLEARGLLIVKYRGRFRPGGGGQASIYELRHVASAVDAKAS